MTRPTPVRPYILAGGTLLPHEYELDIPVSESMGDCVCGRAQNDPIHDMLTRIQDRWFTEHQDWRYADVVWLTREVERLRAVVAGLQTLVADQARISPVIGRARVAVNEYAHMRDRFWPSGLLKLRDALIQYDRESKETNDA